MTMATIGPSRSKIGLPPREEYYVATVAAVKSLGGTATIYDIDDAVADVLALSPEALKIPHGDGRSQFEYDLAWVRTYLKWAGALENPARAQWRLTELGYSLNDEQLRRVPYEVRRQQREQGSLPPIPTQGSGPHFAISEGLLSFARTVEVAGNDIHRINALLPILRETTAALDHVLQKNTGLWPTLERVSLGYSAVISGEINSIDFGRLFGQGILLAHALASAKVSPASGNSFPLTADAVALAESVLDLHGPFILGSKDGQALMADSERYSLTQDQRTRNLRTEIELANAIVAADTLAAPEVKVHLEDAIRSGPTDEKGASYIAAMSRNASIVLVGGAAAYTFGPAALLAAPTAVAGFIGGIFGPEAIKKSKVGTEVTRQLSNLVDRKTLDFVTKNEALFRTLAQRPGMNWVGRALDWTRKNLAAIEPPERNDRELARAKKTTVLLIDPDASYAKSTSRALEELGYEITNVSRGALAAMAFANSMPPDIVVSETTVGRRSGVQIAVEIANLHGSAVVFLTSRPENYPKATFGGYEVLAKPVSTDALDRAISRAIGSKSPPDLVRPKVLAIDPDVEFTSHLRLVLGEWGYDLQFAARSNMSALEWIENSPPDLIISEALLHDGLSKVALDAATSSVLPVIFLTAHPESLPQNMLDGSVPVLAKPLNEYELLQTLVTSRARFLGREIKP
jgi:DNA-binding response OmpR family regulator